MHTLTNIRVVLFMPRNGRESGAMIVVMISGSSTNICTKNAFELDVTESNDSSGLELGSRRVTDVGGRHDGRYCSSCLTHKHAGAWRRVRSAPPPPLSYHHLHSNG